jgi:glycosyltransferase involved in cell wall biosynthesis
MPGAVLHLNTETGWRGGEAQTLYLAEGLEKRGVRCLVVVPPGCPLERRAAARGLAVASVPMHGEWDLLAARRVAALARHHGAGLLHYHTAHAVGIGTLATLFAGRRPAVAARRLSFRIRGRLLGRLKYSWRVDRVIAVSEAIRRSLIAQGIAAGRVVTIHSGIDPGRFSGGDRNRFRGSIAAATRSWPRDAWLIGTAAHLAAHKAIGLFLEAAEMASRDLPQARFVVVGRGEEEGALRHEAARLGLQDRILFAGFRDDMPDVMAGLDLFVLPSTSGEGSPAVLKEAMAAGLPVAATALDGVEEIIQDARHGLLTPPGDAPALARAVVTLSRDGDLRQRLSIEARRRVAEFTIDRMVDCTAEVYASIGGLK